MLLRYIKQQMNRLCIICYLLTWRLAARVLCTYICEKYAEAQIRVYNGKKNCARLDLAIAQEAYTGDWYLPLFGPLICIGIENELSEFSVINRARSPNWLLTALIDSTKSADTSVKLYNKDEVIGLIDLY